MTGDLSKLPKWARDRIEHTERRLMQARQENADLRAVLAGGDGGQFYATNVLQPEIALPSNIHSVGYRHPDQEWSVELNLRSDGELLLWLKDGSRFAFCPQSTNVGRILVESHSREGFE